MVRAAFKGDGRNFHPLPIVSGLHIMAEGTHDKDNGSRDKSPDEAALSARLGSLEQRLSELRDGRKIRTDQTETESGDGAARASAMALGFRLSMPRRTQNVGTDASVRPAGEARVRR